MFTKDIEPQARVCIFFVQITDHFVEGIKDLGPSERLPYI